MRKSEFKEIVQDGINRGRAFMAVKIRTQGRTQEIKDRVLHL